MRSMHTPTAWLLLINLPSSTWLVLITGLLAAVFLAPITTLHADCSAPGGINDGNNNITCDNDPAPPDGDIEGEGGNDTIINRGTALDDIEGDDVDGNGGSDSIVNYGNVQDDIQGDDAGGNGGNDTIINYGIVQNDIEGDDVEGNGGNDSIVNYGRVEDNIEAGGGDDVVIIHFGSHVGDSIDGGPHNTGDTIVIVIHASEDEEASAQALATQIAGQCKPNCNLRLGGMNYRIINFEGSIRVLIEPPQQASAPVDLIPLTASEICARSAKVFLVSNGNLEVYSGFRLLPPNGFLVATIPPDMQQVGKVFSNASTPPQGQGWTATLAVIDSIQRIVVRDSLGNIVNNSCPW